MDYDPTDPDAVADRERRGAVRQTRDRADLRAVLAMPEGRRWVWRVLECGGAFQTSYDPESPLRMAFAEGRRSIGLWLLAEMQDAAPGEFAALISESYAASTLPTTEEDEQ
jgi:hypothetical protein